LTGISGRIFFRKIEFFLSKPEIIQIKGAFWEMGNKIYLSLYVSGEPETLLAFKRLAKELGSPTPIKRATSCIATAISDGLITMENGRINFKWKS